MLMTLLLLASSYAVLRYLEENGVAWLRVAGVATGLAASAKYTAGLGVIWLIAAPVIKRRWGVGLVEALPSLALAGLALVIGTPFAVLDWPTFYAYFAEVASYMQRGWYGAEDRIGYVYYLYNALPNALGWPATALGVLGVGHWLFRGGPQERLLAGFVAAYYAWMGSSKHANENFILPILPFLALCAADFLARAMARFRQLDAARFSWSVVVLAVACLLPPVAQSVRETMLLGARDTREVAGDWIKDHLPPGSRILSEPSGPFLPLTAGRLDEMIAEEERRRPGHGMRLRFDRERASSGQGYWYYEMPLFSDRFLSRPAMEEYDLDRFVDQGYRVVVLSSGVFGRYRRFPERYPAQNAFFERVTRTGRLLIQVDQNTSWCCPRTWNERVAEAAARRWGRPGPTLLVYQLAGDTPTPPTR